MGLLQRIVGNELLDSNEISSKLESHSSGLLAKAQDLSLIKPQSFQNWARSNNFEHCGLFCCIEKTLVLKSAYGLDVESIASSVSTLDFWNGTLNQDMFLSLKSEDLSFKNYLQFFSEKYKNSISYISLLRLKIKDNLYILIICSENKIIFKKKEKQIKDEISETLGYKENCKKDFSLLEKPLSLMEANLYVLEANLALEKIIKLHFDVFNEEIKSIALNCIAEEISFSMNSFFAFPNAIRRLKNNEIEILFFSTTLQSELLQKHIAKNLEEILGETIAEDLVLVSQGKTKNIKEIEDFLSER